MDDIYNSSFLNTLTKTPSSNSQKEQQLAAVVRWEKNRPAPTLHKRCIPFHSINKFFSKAAMLNTLLMRMYLVKKTFHTNPLTAKTPRIGRATNDLFRRLHVQSRVERSSEHQDGGRDSMSSQSSPAHVIYLVMTGLFLGLQKTGKTGKTCRRYTQSFRWNIQDQHLSISVLGLV